MKELVELDSKTHGDCRVAEGCALRFAAGQHVMQVHAAEIGQAACSFPVFFSRTPSTGAWALSVMSGLEIGKNLFAEGGQWTASYQPASMQSYPLFLMKSEANQQGYTVGVTGHDGVLSQDSGEALFDDDGKPSIYLDNVTKLLEAGIQNEIQTRFFAQRLEQLELMKSININVHYQDGAAQTITGLHTIDEDKLQALPANELEELSKNGYLLLMYAMLISIFQLNALIRKNNQTAGCRPIKQAKLALARDVAASDQSL